MSNDSYFYDSNGGCSRCDAMEGDYGLEPELPHPNCGCQVHKGSNRSGKGWEMALDSVTWNDNGTVTYNYTIKYYCSDDHSQPDYEESFSWDCANHNTPKGVDDCIDAAAAAAEANAEHRLSSICTPPHIS
jgi:hypothetical protein